MSRVPGRRSLGLADEYVKAQEAMTQACRTGRLPRFDPHCTGSYEEDRTTDRDSHITTVCQNSPLPRHILIFVILFWPRRAQRDMYDDRQHLLEADTVVLSRYLQGHLDVYSCRRCWRLTFTLSNFLHAISSHDTNSFAIGVHIT